MPEKQFMFYRNNASTRNRLLLLALAVTAGCKWQRGDNSKPPAGAERIVAVEVTDVEAATFDETIRAVGTLETAARIDIRPEVDGVVRHIRFHEGRAVNKGDLLFVLDDSKLQLAVKERQEALDSAKATLYSW